MYLLSFSRLWTLSIERFLFLFWSILNSVTLKTSNINSVRGRFVLFKVKTSNKSALLPG